MSPFVMPFSGEWISSDFLEFVKGNFQMINLFDFRRLALTLNLCPEVGYYFCFLAIWNLFLFFSRENFFFFF
jgi:hypothetical protein